MDGQKLAIIEHLLLRLRLILPCRFFHFLSLLSLSPSKFPSPSLVRVNIYIGNDVIHAATTDHTVEGGNGYVAREGAAREQYKRLHSGGRCGEDHAGA